jgi:hypothetical protein
MKNVLSDAEAKDLLKQAGIAK